MTDEAIRAAFEAAQEMDGWVAQMGDQEAKIEHLLERFVTVVERYVFCTACRSRQPGAANYCMNCGSPIRGGERRPRYEYTELTIPLDLGAPTRRDTEAVKQSYEEIVREHLDLLAEDGWHALGRVDLDALDRAGRVRVRERGGFVGPAWTYESATIRLRRNARAAPARTRSRASRQRTGAHHLAPVPTSA